MTLEERIAELREQAVRLDPEAGHLTDIEIVLAEYDQARKEAYEKGHDVQRLLTERAGWERRVASVLQRQAQLRQANVGQIYLDKVIREALLPITGLVYRVENLPDRLSPKAMAAFKEAVRDIGHAVNDSRRRIEGDPEIKLLGEQRAEIVRLHEYVAERAQAIHQQLATDDGIGCECLGCELIVGLGDIPVVDEPGDGTTS